MTVASCATAASAPGIRAAPPAAGKHAMNRRRLIARCRSSMSLPGSRDPEAREVALGTRPNPQRHAAGRIAELQIVDDETRLLRAVDEQAGLGALDCDAVARPRTRF